MIKKLNEYYLNQLFCIKIISIFINPFYIIRKSLFIAIKKNAIKLKGKMLDFGCGLKPYKKLFINIDEYIGLDIENEGHSHIKEDIDVFYDGKIIPFQNNYFDSLFCSEVFEHVVNLDEIILEIKRVLKPNALCLITMPFIWDEHEIPNDYNRFTSYGIKEFLKKNGFEIIQFTKTSNFLAVVFQMYALYIYKLFNTKNKYINILINLVFISPITILGVFFSNLLPKKKTLYFNNVIFAKKK